jgi:PHD/YefM family antitoxin component YafN of YafNO toxin-antitoxin module
MKVVTDEFAANCSEHIAYVDASGRKLLITKNGKPWVILEHSE